MTKRWRSPPTVGEAKAEATTAAAKLLVDAETVSSHAKMERLRAARLVRDASESQFYAETVTPQARQSGAKP